MTSLCHPCGRASLIRNGVPDHGLRKVKALHASGEKPPLHLALLTDGLPSRGAGADMLGEAAYVPHISRKRRPVEA